MLLADGPYRNTVAFGITLAVCDVWLRITRVIAARNLLSPAMSRKLVHIATGIIFCVCWPLFDQSNAAKFWAAAIPGLITAKFSAIGFGLLSDPESVRSMSRSGDPRELLGGPLAYGIVFVVATILQWRTTIAIAALMALCCGDGFAPVFGGRSPKRPLPWHTGKTVLGSMAFYAATFISTCVLLAYGQYHLWFLLPGRTVASSATINWVGTMSLVTMLVESVPISICDNYTVAAAVFAADFLGILDVFASSSITAGVSVVAAACCILQLVRAK